MENSTANPTLPAGRYLKYALGEIVLVVIGILIALQINNWNEIRKDGDLEQGYLKNLIEDLKADIDYTELNVLNRYDKKIKSLELGKAFFQGNYIPMDTLNFLAEIRYGGVFGNIVWDFKKTTYDELVNTGNFRKIKNDSLRKAIIDYYNYLNRTYESTSNKQSGYIPFTNSKAPFDRDNPESISEFDQKFFLESLKSGQFYEVTNLEITLAYKIHQRSITILQMANDLIKSLENHIKR
ncbi:MAG: DUF6090 family protein [Maribacter sp.]|nr:DUF6090 family protein [Maribacter sp.]